MTKFYTYYMDDAVFRLPHVLQQAEISLRHAEEVRGIHFDTLVGTGLSGSIVVPALALRLGKKFVIVRKDVDDSHHGKGRLVGDLGVRWIFVDDFISSGKTRLRVVEKVTEWLKEYGSKSEMVGQYMYIERAFDGPTFTPYSDEWEEPLW